MGYDLEATVAAIDPTKLSYDEWLNVGQALQAEGYPCEVWSEWSQGDERFKPGECEMKWRGFDAGGGIAGGTIVHIAQQHGIEPVPLPDGTERPKRRTPRKQTKADPYHLPTFSTLPDATPLETLDLDPADMLRAYMKALFLDADYVNVVRPGEWGFGCTPTSSGCAADAKKMLEHYDQFGRGLFVRVNPVTTMKERRAKTEQQKRDFAEGKRKKKPDSSFTDADVTGYDHALVESDDMPQADQLDMIRRLHLPCAAIVDSANKSIHAIVRIDADSVGQYRERVRALYGYCERNGLTLDKGCKNPSRLSRLPGAMRDGKLQRLLAVDVGPGSWEEFVREVQRLAKGNSATEAPPGGYDPEYGRGVSLGEALDWDDADGSPELFVDVIEAGGEDGGAWSSRERRILATGILDAAILDDLNLARAFGKAYRDRLRYVAEARRYYSFDGRRWDSGAKGDHLAAECCKQFVVLLTKLITRVEDDERRKLLLSCVVAYNGQAARARLLKDARSTPSLLASVADFDRDLDLLNLENATLDLRTMEAHPHRAQDMLTKLAGCKYDPDASDGPWERFLLESFQGDVEVVRYLQQQVGLALCGDTHLERMHFLYGVTRSGKSTTCRVLQVLFGDYAVGVSSATITKQRRSGQAASGDLARLDGVRLGIIPEPQLGMQLSSEIIKLITGGDPITARQLYQSERDFTPHVSLWVASNHVPLIDDQTVFESGRIWVLPFDRHLDDDQQDKGLKRRLCSPRALSGVLNWVIEGLRSFRVSPLDPPSTVVEATVRFAGETDETQRFVDEALVRDCTSYMTGGEAFDLYRQWRGSPVGELGKQGFLGALRRLGMLCDRATVDGHRRVKNVILGFRAR